MSPKAPKRTAGKRQPSGRPRAEGKASFGWLIPVAVLSAFVGFILYLGTIEPLEESQPREAATSTPAPTVSEEPARPQFRFYDMLPESEVVTPDVNAYDPGPDMRERQVQYILQTGSFRSAEDAERQRAQIGFQGLRAQVNEIALAEDNVWYRVQVGPYENRSEMNRAIDRLVAINIQPLVRQRSTAED